MLEAQKKISCRIFRLFLSLQWKSVGSKYRWTSLEY